MPEFDKAMHGLVGAIVVAAGASTRMAGTDKVFTDLGGMPVLAHSVGALESCDSIARIVLVVAEANLGRAAGLVAEQGWQKAAHICAGGARRQDSVAAGLRYLDDCDWIMVHDGARPFLSPALLARALSAALRWGAAIPGVAVKDTIKVVRDGAVQASLNRSSLIAVQTPQVFKSAIIREAYAKLEDDVTDDASLVERLGYKVGVFEGSLLNLKITTPEDLTVARCFLE